MIKIAIPRWALLASLLPALSAFSGVGFAQSAPPPDAETEVDESLLVTVPFVTNRGMDAERAFTGDRGVPSLGLCEVAFTSIAIVGDLAPKMPFHVPSETTEIRRTEAVDGTTFWKDLRHAALATTSGTVVLFVHGYNYGLERTCGMAANLQRALAGRAAVLAVSWPSNGKPTDYLPDVADVEWSVPFIADTIGELVDRLGAERIQVMAHSLGSRGVVYALERLAGERDVRPIVSRLVLAAPDFDAETFVDRLPRLLPLVGHLSLYASSNDGALKASRQLHGAARLGEAGEFLTVEPGLETIDVTSAGRYQVLGHEYFHFHPQVSADVVSLLGAGLGAGERSGLVARTRDGRPYWEPAPAR